MVPLEVETEMMKRCFDIGVVVVALLAVPLALAQAGSAGQSGGSHWTTGQYGQMGAQPGHPGGQYGYTSGQYGYTGGQYGAQYQPGASYGGQMGAYRGQMGTYGRQYASDFGYGQFGSYGSPYIPEWSYSGDQRGYWQGGMYGQTGRYGQFRGTQYGTPYTYTGYPQYQGMQNYPGQDLRGGYYPSYQAGQLTGGYSGQPDWYSWQNRYNQPDWSQQGDWRQRSQQPYGYSGYGQQDYYRGSYYPGSAWPGYGTNPGWHNQPASYTQLDCRSMPCPQGYGTVGYTRCDNLYGTPCYNAINPYNGSIPHEAFER